MPVAGDDTISSAEATNVQQAQPQENPVSAEKQQDAHAASGSEQPVESAPIQPADAAADSSMEVRPEPAKPAAKPAAASAAAKPAKPYKFESSGNDVTVEVPVPKGTRGRDVIVEFGVQHLKVGLKGQPPIIDGELYSKVKRSECVWTVEDNERIHLQLVKMKEYDWWPRLMKDGSDEKYGRRSSSDAEDSDSDFDSNDVGLKRVKPAEMDTGAAGTPPEKDMTDKNDEQPPAEQSATEPSAPAAPVSGEGSTVPSSDAMEM